MIQDDVYLTPVENIDDNGNLKDDNQVYKLLKIESQVLVDASNPENPQQVVNVLLFCVHPNDKTNPSIAVFTPQTSVSLGLDYYENDDYDDDDDDSDDDDDNNS